MPGSTKTCRTCKKIKPISQFHKDNTKPDGHMNSCKSCRSAKTREYYIANADKIKRKTAEWASKNKDRIRLYQSEYTINNREAIADRKREWCRKNIDHCRRRLSEWRSRNKDKVSAISQRWSSKNRDKVRVIAKRYRQKNPESARDSANKWRRKNPHKTRFYCVTRDKFVRVATPGWADRKKMAELYRLSREMTKLTGIQHSVDHIVPLNSKLVCGLHWEGNMRVMPAGPNAAKGNRHWPEMP